jgi:hypothetical protein
MKKPFKTRITDNRKAFVQRFHDHQRANSKAFQVAFDLQPSQPAQPVNVWLIVETVAIWSTVAAMVYFIATH